MESLNGSMPYTSSPTYYPPRPSRKPQHGTASPAETRWPTSRCTHHWTNNAPGSHQPSPTNSSHQLINQQLPIFTSTTCTTWTAPVCTIYDTNSTCQRHQLLTHRSTVPNPKHQPSFDPHHSTAQFDRQCRSESTRLNSSHSDRSRMPSSA